MKKRFRYIAYTLASIAFISAIFLTKDKIAEAANKIYLDVSDLTLELGHYKTLKVYGTSQKPTFKSANDKAATVSSSGKITAQGWGSTTVYTYVADKTLKTKVTIVQMNNKDVALTPGKTYQLTLWGSDSSTSWKSSNKKVATVSDNGLVTAVGNGTATITATFNDKKITSTVTVFSLNKDYAVLEYGGRFSITRPNYGSKVKLKLEGGNDKVTWESNNPSVATVDSNGKVTAKGPGKAMITASLNGAQVSAEIKVLQMNSSQLELSAGQNYQLSVLGTNNDIKWRTLNKTVVTVDENGLVKAVGRGTTKVIAEVDGMLIRSVITVK